MADFSPTDEAAQLLETKPHSVRAHVLLGEQHAAKGNDQDSAYYFRRALHLALFWASICALLATRAPATAASAGQANGRLVTQ